MSRLGKTTFAALIVMVAVLGSTVSGQSVAKEPIVRVEGLQAFTFEAVLKLFSERQVWLAKNQQPTSDVPAKATTVLKEALESRGYMRASIEARYDADANTLTLLVVEGPRFSIGEIRFAGNKMFSSQELAARMQEFIRGYEWPSNAYNEEVFDVCLRRLGDFARSRGYLQAHFGEPKKELADGQLIVTVPITEGALYRLGEVKIEGVEHLNKERVRALLSLQRRDIVDGEAIGQWLFEDLKKLYGEIGFVQYTAEIEPEFRAVDQATNEGVVDLTVTIEEGRQFKIRSIKFEGSNLSDQDLSSLLLIRAGDIFNNQFFEKSVQQLNATKRFETIDKDKDADFITDKEADLLDITLRVKRVQTP